MSAITPGERRERRFDEPLACPHCGGHERTFRVVAPGDALQCPSCARSFADPTAPTREVGGVRVLRSRPRGAWLVRVTPARGQPFGPREVGFLRRVSPSLAAHSIAMLRTELEGAPDVVLGRFDRDAAEAIRTAAVGEGLVAEITTASAYNASFIRRRLGCGPLGPAAVRVTLRPSFAAESVVSVQRMDAGYRVELRCARESLWRTQFGEWVGQGIVRRPGVDIVDGLVTGAAASRGDKALASAAAWAREPHTIGLDGTRVSFETTLPALPAVFEAWSPHAPGGRAFELLRVVVGLAASLGNARADEWAATMPEYRV